MTEQTLTGLWYLALFLLSFSGFFLLLTLSIRMENRTRQYNERLAQDWAVDRYDDINWVR